jgi:endonuclease/exonuclease/phosphatase family metal-dependent hydrolase
VSEPLRLRVLTYNIHGGRPAQGPVDLPAIIDVIRHTEADLIALQEVHRFLPPWNAFRDQPNELADALGMEVAFLPSFRLAKAGYGNVILSRAPLKGVQRVRLPRGGEPRVVLIAGVEIQGVAFRFLNTHLEYREGHRVNQAPALAELVRTHPAPLILTGDLNAGPESAELRALRAAGLTSGAPPDLSTFPSDAPTAQIDHILVTEGCRILSCDTLASTASDHLPVLAVVELATDAAASPAT